MGGVRGMKHKVVLILAITAVLLSCLFVGCGVPQEEYNRVNAQLRASQAQVAELQGEIRRTDAELGASQAQIVELQSEIKELKERYEIIGETPAETAENIVRWYHETHIYSEYDFFVCSDMALDVWNMLKAQGIDALIQIGNVETDAKDITEVNHAWVLAKTSPGHYLALETTGGYVVYKDGNELYYKGWSFDNPREYKRFTELKQEYNIRVSIIEQLATKYQKTYEDYQELLNEFNRRYIGRPVSLESQTQLAVVKEKEGRCSQLAELINEQQLELQNIVSEMMGLTD